jgi:hypothetical protein
VNYRRFRMSHSREVFCIKTDDGGPGMPGDPAQIREENVAVSNFEFRHPDLKRRSCRAHGLT